MTEIGAKVRGEGKKKIATSILSICCVRAFGLSATYDDGINQEVDKTVTVTVIVTNPKHCATHPICWFIYNHFSVLVHSSRSRVSELLLLSADLNSLSMTKIK